MSKIKYLKTKDSGDVLIGKSKADIILLCDWYVGFTTSLVDSGKAEDVKRMEILN